MDLSSRQGRREQGLRIQRAVERAGLSIEELAGRIGCSRALIYQYLSGSTLAQPDRLQQIAQECSVPLTFFYGEEPEPATEPGSPPVAAPAVGRAPVPSEEVAARLTDSLRAFQELAVAQESPPDYRALAATCERILSLAAQLGDRVAQARAQLRLGNALLSIADYPRAADALTRAIALAQEVGVNGSETAARQSLGKALVAMGRSREAGEQFARIANGPDLEGRWQGTLSLGCLHEMRGEYRQAMQRFDEASAILEEAEAAAQMQTNVVAIGLLYVNANRVNVYLDEGDFRGALPLAEKCLVDAEALGDAEQHLEAHLNLAWCEFSLGRWNSAYRHLTTMLRLARFIGDQGRETLARAWLGLFLAAAGDFDAAIAHGKDALAMALSRGDRRAELYGQLALADAYTGQTRRESEARYHTSQALAVATALRHDRDEIECRLRLARLSAQAGDLTELRDAASRALVLARRLGARHLESLAHLWLAVGLEREKGRKGEGEREGTGNREQGTEPTTQLPNYPTTQHPTPNTQHPTPLQEAQAALEIAQELGLVEAAWRANAALAALARQASPEEAESHLRAAVTLLETLRASLREAGIPDTLLENEECVGVYDRLARLLRQRERGEEAEAFLDQTGWPPLTARLAAEAGEDADRP